MLKRFELQLYFLICSLQWNIESLSECNSYPVNQRMRLYSRWRWDRRPGSGYEVSRNIVMGSLRRRARSQGGSHAGAGWSTNSYKWTSPHDPVWLTEPTIRTMDTVKPDITRNVNKDGRIIYIPRWRGGGGTSRVYGSIVRRPSPEVLKLSPKGWKHDDLLPYYKKSEDHYCHYDT